MSNLGKAVFLAAVAASVPVVGAIDAARAEVSMADHGARPADIAVDAEANAVVAFWREAGPALWFAKDADFDRRFRERFAGAYALAAGRQLDHWASSACDALALVILLDQYPRNAFRGAPRMYATDALARTIADAAIRKGFDRRVDQSLAIFFYLPFAHSEDIADQDRAVQLVERLGEPDLTYAKHHRDIIRRFGRFPHRNSILGREMRPEERRYLEDGGFAG